MIPRILAAGKTMSYAWFSFPICTLTSCEELNQSRGLLNLSEQDGHAVVVEHTHWRGFFRFDHQAGCDTLINLR